MSGQNDITVIPAPLPADYDRQTNFNDTQVANPTQHTSGSLLDIEFNAVEQALDQTQARLRLIQRDDGAVLNASIGHDQLKPEVLIGVNQPTNWTAFTAYATADSVFTNGLEWYLCLTSHISSNSFATDLASGKWRLLVDLAVAGTAASVAFTPSNNLSATDVQTMGEELDTEKAGLALNNTFTGPNTFDQTIVGNGDFHLDGNIDFTQASVFIRNITAGAVTQKINSTFSITPDTISSEFNYFASSFLHPNAAVTNWWGADGGADYAMSLDHKNRILHLNSPIHLDSGHIKFPSTPVPSSDPNTLDAYDEGDFTPTVYGSGVVGTPTYAKQTGYYTRTGNRIDFNIRLRLTAKTGISGEVLLGGLPEFSSSDVDNVTAVTVGNYQGVSVTQGQIPMAKLGIGVGVIRILLGGGTTGRINMDDSHITNIFEIELSGQYKV